MIIRRNGTGFRLKAGGFGRTGGTGYCIAGAAPGGHDVGCTVGWDGTFVGVPPTTTISGGASASWPSYFDHQGGNNFGFGKLNCSSVPSLTDQSVMSTWLAGDYGVGSDGGGPAVYVSQDPTSHAWSGYCLQILNRNTDITATHRVLLSRSNANTPTEIAGVNMPDNPPFGPLGVHFYAIRAEIVTSVHANDVRLRVYVDAAPGGLAAIDFTDTSSLRLPVGTPGFYAVARSVFGGYIARDTTGKP